MPCLIDPKKYTKTISGLRTFFEQKGFLEVHTQNRLSILAACEDPDTIAKFGYAGEEWPLPQTGQMWLEYELLKDPECPGFYCISTSYRNEPNPIEGRHDIIFPMFEFEFKGDMDDLIKLEKDLLKHLGFNEKYYEGNYTDIANLYNVEELEHKHEMRLSKDYGNVFFLKNFPEKTSPFWNMKRDENDPNIAKKVDVILHGVETIGSAERSTDKKEMEECFRSISDGQYAQTLYHQFGKERVENELKNFLNNKFFDRVGAGVGITRMIRAMELSNLI